MKKTLAIIGVMLLLIGVALLIGYRWGRNTAISSMKPEVITRVIRDTTTQFLPVYQKEYVYCDRYIEIPVHDTLSVTHHDTVAVVVPYTVREYRDSSYFAKVGGYKPELLQIETYNRTVYQTTYVPEEKRWGLGVQAGFGIAYQDRFIASPYIGIGISYNFLCW